LFLLGAFVARHKLRYNLFAAALAFVASALFVASEFYSVPHLTPRRFPPNAIWIVGSACIVYLFLGLATISAAKAHRAAQRYLNALGQSVLYYLVLSNLVIFALAALGLKQGLNLHSGLIVYVILMAFLFFLQSIVTDYRRATEVFDRRLDQPRRVGTLSGRLADSAQDAGHGRATQEEARHSAYEEARHSAYEEARHST
jgi:divalent metal cation (Fe/Co/Zn/Cd) transporter